MVDLIIADDHVVLREALCEMLEGKGEYRVVGQAGNGDELVKLLDNQTADVIIMDISMPECDGVEAMQKLIAAGAKFPPVLILSANGGEKSIRDALKAGAKGYLPKNAGFEELQFAINSIIQGQTYLSPAITEPLMSGGGVDSPLDDPLSVLTPREIEIMTLLADGKPNREIAKMLHISIRTVDTHRSNILRKLKVKTNAELVKIAIANDLISV